LIRNKVRPETKTTPINIDVEDKKTKIQEIKGYNLITGAKL
jgi:hypothetical protein